VVVFGVAYPAGFLTCNAFTPSQHMTRFDKERLLKNLYQIKSELLQAKAELVSVYLDIEKSSKWWLWLKRVDKYATLNELEMRIRQHEDEIQAVGRRITKLHNSTPQATPTDAEP
jgi:hypothetical protein